MTLWHRPIVHMSREALQRLYPPPSLAKSLVLFVERLGRHASKPDMVDMGDGWVRPNWRRRWRKNRNRVTWGHQRP